MTIKRCYPVLVGASVGENQLFGTVSSDFWNTSNYKNGTVSFADGECTYTVVTVGTSYGYGIRNKTGTIGIVRHKYLVSVNAKASRDGITIGGDIVNVGFTFNGSLTASYQKFSRILSATGTQDAFICTRSNTQVGDTITFKDMMLIDLTQMFGSTIADYAYTLEQATAGSGIAWLRSYGFLTDDYLPYNAGTIESVEATAKVVRDANGENAITYPLGSDVLRGLFKLDANNQLYADGDRKAADGTITRKYGIVDLGTLTWSTGTDSSGQYFKATLSPVAKSKTSSDFGNNLCSKYPMTSSSNVYDKSIALNNAGNTIYVRDTSYSTASDFQTAMSGVYLVYELATPTTETSTPFISPQICYPDGTEEFVTENGVPVGHETKYQL